MAQLQPQVACGNPSMYAVQYKMQEISGATPEQLILHIYDFAIASCLRKDIDNSSRALAELIDALNFDYQDIAVGLFRLYRFMIESVKAGQFDLPLDLLRKLRDTWSEAIAKREAA